jgi:RNA polymerase I-specific transcription initiation factor RRN7
MSLYNACAELVKYLHVHHAVIVPEINLPPIAWRIVSSLGGTPTVYAQVIQLMTLLDVNLRYHTDHTVLQTAKPFPTSSAGSSKLQMLRLRDETLPELAVVAAWVIVMKMNYGLDGVNR